MSRQSYAPIIFFLTVSVYERKFTEFRFREAMRAEIENKQQQLPNDLCRITKECHIQRARLPVILLAFRSLSASLIFGFSLCHFLCRDITWREWHFAFIRHDRSLLDGPPVQRLELVAKRQQRCTQCRALLRLHDIAWRRWFKLFWPEINGVSDYISKS